MIIPSLVLLDKADDDEEINRLFKMMKIVIDEQNINFEISDPQKIDPKEVVFSILEKLKNHVSVIENLYREATNLEGSN